MHTQTNKYAQTQKKAHASTNTEKRKCLLHKHTSGRSGKERVWWPVPLQETNKRLCLREMPGNLPAQLLDPNRTPAMTPNTQKCNRQTIFGTCTNGKSPYFMKPCPGIEPGADIKDCEFVELIKK